MVGSIVFYKHNFCASLLWNFLGILLTAITEFKFNYTDANVCIGYGVIWCTVNVQTLKRLTK